MKAEHAVSPYWDESDKEWWARGGYKAKGGFDAIDFGQKQVQAPHEIEQHQPASYHRPGSKLGTGSTFHMPEHDFWCEFFTLVVHDALGITASAKGPCLDCRDEWVEARAVGPMPARDTERHQPIRQLLAQRAWPRHTIQQCAKDYLASDLAKEDAMLLGIEIDYLRKLVADGTDKRKKWQVFNFGPIGGR